MIRPLLIALLSALAFSAPAAEPVADDAVFVEGARYDAVLRRQAHAWRLLAASGADLRLRVAGHCQAGAPPPRGLWLLTRDEAGAPALLAPSSTPLPADHPGEVRLVPCGQPLPGDRPALAVPAPVIDWLATNGGAVYVAD